MAAVVSLAGWLLTTVNAQAAFTPTKDALAVARAIAEHPSFVVGAAFETAPANRETAAVSTDALAGFWTSQETPDFAVLSTGDVAKVVPDTDPAQFARASDDLGGEAFRGGAERDVTMLRIDVVVPHGATCMSIDYRFFTEESAHDDPPAGPFDDAFIAELDKSDWLAIDGKIAAPSTFATTPLGSPVTAVSSAVFLNADAALGTTFDRATPLWQAWTPVTPGNHALYLTVFDTTDSERDSAVFLDQLAFGVERDGEACEPGTTLVTQIAADEAQTLVGGTNGFRIFVEAVGGAEPIPAPGPGGSPVNAPLELTALAAISSQLAAGFSYVPRSTTGTSTEEPEQDTNGGLVWTGPFAAAPAPTEDLAELGFRVTVPDKPGTYFTSASVKAAEEYFILPSPPAAPIEVVLPSADLTVAYEQRPMPARLDGKVELIFVVTNAGPQAATGAVLEAKLPLSLTQGEVSTSQGECKLGEILTCKLGTIAVNASVTITVSGVLGGADLAFGANTRALELDADLANNALGADASVIAADKKPTPVVGETVATKANKGRVKVKPPDEKKFVEIEKATEIPVGTTIDARKGEVKITAAVDEDGDVQAASFAKGKFVVQQQESGLTTLKIVGGDFSQCAPGSKSKGKEAARQTQRFIKDGARGRRVIRRLWGRGKGKFRTRGRYAAATVRGTVWRTVDRCDGTLIRVKRGVVIVRDVNRKRALKVKAGDQYLVKRKGAGKKTSS